MKTKELAAKRFMGFVSLGKKFMKGCWTWEGTLNSKGYGRFWYEGRMVLAHRASLLLSGVPIPKGMTVDHMCRAKRCVNPSHLRLLSLRDNILAGDCPPAVNARKSECKRGHPLDSGNVYLFAKGRQRQCKICWKAIRKKQRLTLPSKSKKNKK
jgi:hypothetical protein